jgi:hypothetical protein
VQDLDTVVARLGVSNENRAMWRSIQSLIGAGAALSVQTECTGSGPSANLHVLYGPTEWDRVIDVVKVVCSLQRAREAAAALGKLGAAFEQAYSLQVVFLPDQAPDVLVWLRLRS